MGALLAQLFFQKLGEQFDGEVLGLHPLQLLEEGFVEERELQLVAVEKVDDALAVEALVEEARDAFVDFVTRNGALLRKADEHHAKGIEIGGFGLLLLGQKRTAKRGCVVEGTAVLHHVVALLLATGIGEPVGAARDGIGLRLVEVAEEAPVVEAVDELAADVEFLLPLHEGGLGDVGVAETLLVALRILLHGCLEGLGDADVIDDETTFLAGENAIDTGNGLHEVVAAHRLIDVHGGERRHIEAREPHVAHDGNLHRVVVVLELLRQLLLVVVVADDLLPVLGVLVARRHHDLHLVGP